MSDHNSSEINNSIRERHLDFIKINWALLASASYKSYLEKGRGILIVDEQDFNNKPKGEYTKFKTFFISVSSGKLPGIQEKEWVETL